MYLNVNPPFSKCFYLKILFCDVYWLFSNSVVLFVLVYYETENCLPENDCITPKISISNRIGSSSKVYIFIFSDKSSRVIL